MPRRNWPHCRALSGIWQPQPLRLLLNQRISLYPRRSITAHRTTHNEPSSSALARTRPGMNQHESQDHPRPIDRFSPPPTYTLLAATSVLIFCAASNAPSLFPAADQPPTGNHVTGLLTHYTRWRPPGPRSSTTAGRTRFRSMRSSALRFECGLPVKTTGQMDTPPPNGANGHAVAVVGPGLNDYVR